MRWASFRRAACFGGNQRRRWWIYGLGFSSALLAVLLVADVGLILDFVHSLRGGELGRTIGHLPPGSVGRTLRGAGWTVTSTACSACWRRC